MTVRPRVNGSGGWYQSGDAGLIDPYRMEGSNKRRRLCDRSGYGCGAPNPLIPLFARRNHGLAIRLAMVLFALSSRLNAAGTLGQVN